MFKPADPPFSPPNQARYTDYDNESTQQEGVLIVNTDADPMWLDFGYRLEPFTFGGLAESLRT